MAEAAKEELTLERIQALGKSTACNMQGKGNACCLHRESVSALMEMAAGIYELWDAFNKTEPAFHKGQALLDYFVENRIWGKGSKKKVRFRLSAADDTPICDNCWRVCAGFSKPNGKPSSLYSRTLASFNEGITNVRDDKESVVNKQTGQNKMDLSVAVDAFLETWLEHNSDCIPEDSADVFGLPPRVHVDVARKKDIWIACCEHLDREQGNEPESAKTAMQPPVSLTHFTRMLNKKVRVVIHKHKKFSQCVTCFLFKQLMAKCKNKEDMKDIRAHRRGHFKTVYNERVIYHKTRTWAKEYPEEALSMIIDAQTAWRTKGPTMARELGSGGFPESFEAFGQQLYGCLVHADPQDLKHLGGFFGYMVDDSVKGGGNVTCEIIHRTLQILQQHREIWPSLFDLRLDNTTKDNKNAAVLGFLGWLVLIGCFEKVRVRFLPVGHTHEDIDALFGVLMKFLYKGQCFQTIQILMDAIYESFFQTDAKHAASTRPSQRLQHMRATYNWTAWLTEACAERTARTEAVGASEEEILATKKPPWRKIEKYARRVSDAHRPHEMEFSMGVVNGVRCVVVNYKHWSNDQQYWNKEPIPCFNYVPDLQDLKPNKLNPKVTTPLAKCAAAPSFKDHTKMCSQTKSKPDEGQEAITSLQKQCPRCSVHIALLPPASTASMFTPEHVDSWGDRFANMTQESSEATLPPKTPLKHYTPKDERTPFVLPGCMQGPSDAYLAVPPITYEGYSEAQYRRLLAEAGVGVLNSSESSYAVENVAGVHKDTRGKVTVAVVWANDDSKDGGTWIPLEDLNVEHITECEEDTLKESDPQEQLQQAVKEHNWEMYFGRDMPVVDEEVICGFTYNGRTTTCWAVFSERREVTTDT